MAVTNEQLIAHLDANIRKFEKSMDRAAGKTNQTFTKIEKRGKKLQKRLNAIDPKFSRLLGPAAIGVAVRGFQVLADAATRVENSLKVAGLTGQDLERVYEQLEASAKKNFAPFETLVDLYSKGAQAQKELNVSSEELVNFTDKVSVALRVNGKSAAESRGALIQLSQAIGSGVVRAEEFNAILEGARPIAQAAAAGLKEAGGSVAKLRTLVIDGKVSSEAFFRAFEAGAVILEDKVADAAITSSQGFETLKTKLITAARKMDDAVPVMRFLTDSLGTMGNAAEKAGELVEQMADSWASIDNRKLVGPLKDELRGIYDERQKLIEQNKQLTPKEGSIFASSAKGAGSYDTPDFIEKIETNKKKIVEFNKEAGKLLDRINQLEHGTLGLGDKVDPVTKVDVKSVSLNDFDSPSTKKKSRKKRTPGDKFADDVSRIKARTLAIQAETAAQSALNPLINDYEYAISRASAKQDLLNDAKKAGLKINADLERDIDILADAYASATVEANKLQESQDGVIDRAQEFNSLGQDVLGSFIRDMRDGKSATEALGNSLSRIADKLLDMAVQNLFSNALGGSSFNGGGGGFLSALFGKPPRYASGTNYHPGGQAIVGEKGPELVNLPRGSQVIPNNKMGGGGSSKLEIILSPELEAKILEAAAGQSVQISTQQITQYDKSGVRNRLEKLQQDQSRYG